MPTDRDAAVDAVMAAVAQLEVNAMRVARAAAGGSSLLDEIKAQVEDDRAAVRAAVEQYGREQWDNGRYDALRMVLSEDTTRRAADMTYHNVERELAELERQRGAPDERA